MLPPDSRAVLTEALRPPVGAVLDRAVALTFTLDLESALTIPLAFAGQALRDSQDPIAIMEAVRRCADKVDVFCQAGAISVPKVRSQLLAYLESMVHPVTAPRPGGLFHPKVWLVRFLEEDTGIQPLRLLVLSRNLTADRSWDLCLQLDGVVGTQPHASNSPLITLLRETLDMAIEPIETDRRVALDALVQDVRRAEWDLPEFADSVSLHALGIPGGSTPDFSGTRHLVVSPFCNEAGLNLVAPGNGSVLVARQEELDRLPTELLDGSDVYVLDEAAGIPSEESDGSQGMLSGLHAKFYVVEYNGRPRMMLGSPNATDAAFSRNVEFVVEIEGKRRDLGIDSIVGIDGDFRSVLSPYQRQPATTADEGQHELEKALRSLAATPFHAQASELAAGWTEHVTTRSSLTFPTEFRVTIELLTAPGSGQQAIQNETCHLRFERLQAVDITPFVILHIADSGGRTASTVVRALLTGDPADRLDQILAQQIDTPEKFLQLLALLLGQSFDLAGTTNDGAGSGTSWFGSSGPGILELLLEGLADRPSQLDDLARLVTRLQATPQGAALLPAGFAELWTAVAEVREELAAESVR